MSAVETANQMFQSLFFGDGWFLGMLLIIAIEFPMVMKWRETAVLFIPGTIFMMFEYIDNSLGWPAIVFMILSFLMLYLAAARKGTK